MDGSERVEITMSGSVKNTEGKKAIVDFPSHKGKYRNFSSYQMDEGAYPSCYIENVFQNGCEAKNCLLYAMRAENDFTAAWVTEGEKKAIYANKCLSQPVIAVPGVNSFMLLLQKEKGVSALDLMRQRGVRRFVIAYDADRDNNKMVLQNQNKLAELLVREGFEVFIACWDIRTGKGLDDLLSAGELPWFYRFTGEAHQFAKQLECCRCAWMRL